MITVTKYTRVYGHLFWSSPTCGNQLNGTTSRPETGRLPFGTQEVLPALLPLPGRESAEELSQTSRQPLSNPKIRDYVETVKLCTLFTIPLLSCLKGELRRRESRASERSTGCPLERKEGKQYKTTTQSKAATLAYLGAVPGKGGFPSVWRSCLPALPQRTRLAA